MNILTFDFEEWYLEKTFYGGREFKYRQFDEMFHQLLDELDRQGIKATFFCVGKLALEFPDVVITIAARGHEVGCHSNEHTWLDKMGEMTLRKDTTEAIKALEDVSGQKVVSYRAPAFSITEKNKWAFGILSECGIENDSSVFPATRDFGGYPTFPQDTPCRIEYQGCVINEFPIPQISLFGKQLAFSGGGYFRLLPYSYVHQQMKKRDYNICYYHLKDLINEKIGMLSKAQYEEYFKEPGTLYNRWSRYLKDNLSGGDAYKKLTKLISKINFIGVSEASRILQKNVTDIIRL